MATSNQTKTTSYVFKLVDGFTAGLRGIGKGVTALNQQLANLNQTSELVSKTVGAIGTGFGLGPALTEAGQLEDILARVNSITGATVEQQQALQAAVVAASQATRFSAEEAAGALALLAEDGLSATEAVEQLGTVLQFAQGNAQSAAQAAQGLGAVLDTFGESASGIGSLADQLTAVARASGTSTSALQQGLATAGVAAQQAGVSIQTTVAALGALAKAGLDGNAAGKQLTKILQEISDGASPAGEALRTLGIDTSDFGAVLQRLGADSAAAEKVLAALGDRPRAALAALLAEGGAALTELTGVIQTSAGASRDAADALQNTFLGSLAQVTNALANARTQFLAPLLKPLADEFSGFAARITEFVATDQFAQISGQFKAFVLESVNGLVNALGKVDFQSVTDGLVSFGNAAVTTAKAGAALLVFLGDAVGALQNLYSTVRDVITDQAHLDGTLFTTAERLRNLAIAAAAANGDLAELARLNGITAEEFVKTAGAAKQVEEAVVTLTPQVNQLAGTQSLVAEETRKWNDQNQALIPGLLQVREGVDAAAAAASDFEISSAQLAPNFSNAAEAASASAAASRKAAQAFAEAGASAESSGEQIVQAYGVAVKQALTTDEVNRLQIEFAKLGNDGRVSLEQLADGARIAGDRLRELGDAVSREVTAAFAQLKITSQRDLQAAADAAQKSFDTIQQGASRGEASVADLRAAFVALARQQLAVVENAGEAERAQVESSIRARAQALGLVDALQEVGLAGQQAGAAVADGASLAAQALDSVAASASEAAGSISGLGTASQSAAAAVEYTSGAIVKAGGELRGYSAAAIAAANSVESLGVSSRRIGEQVEAQQLAVAELTRRYREQARASDPVEQALDRLARQYPLVARESLRAAAEQEAAANRATAAVNGTTAALQRQQQVTQSTSSVSSPGGAVGTPTGIGLTGRPASPNQPAPQFQAPQAQSNVTFNAVVADDRDLEQLVRRAAPIIRRVLRLGNAL